MENILQILLVTAHYMGYKNIYLVGFDYSFLAYKNKNQIPHFHGGDKRAYKPEVEKKSYTRVTCNVCKLLNSLIKLNIHILLLIMKKLQDIKG